MSKLSYCGLDCEICPAYIATRDGNADLLEETAQRWSELYHSTMTPKDILCGGCTSGSGIVNCHWHECEIRICAEEKKVQNCGNCDQYACETIKALTSLVPEAKEALDSIHSKD